MTDVALNGKPTPVAMKKANPVITPNIPEILSNVEPKLFIDGKFVDAVSGKTFPLIDPRTGDEIHRVAEADAADVDVAVIAAKKAFEEGPWPKMSARARGKILFKLAELLEANSELLARLETTDTGKPLKMSRAVDIPYGIDHVRYFAGYADKIYGKTIQVDGDFQSYTLREPIGVVGQITPWNFPFCMMVWKIAPALAAGNSIILKPAEQTPLTALKTAELALEAGVPPGVFNVLPGYGPTAGAALTRHLDVEKIAFTGSTEVGQKIMQMASINVKDISLELGGKSPFIIFPDADLDKAIEQACNSVYFNQGQCCDSPSRLFVHKDVFDQVVEKAAAFAAKRTVGDPFDEVDQGPQIDEDQFNKVLNLIKSGKDQGADLVCGGCPIGEKGFYIEPTVFANVKDEMKIAQEEIFGPVQSIFKFETIDEVIKRANDVKYGLASCVYSKDIDVINKVTRGIKAGTVWVNCYQCSDHSTPFGGYKMSGIGRDRGEEAILQYTQTKCVTTTLVNPPWL